MNDVRKINTVHMVISFVMSVVFAAVGSILLYYFIYNNGMYPSGSDTMYHVFRGDLFYRSVMSGNGYPLYNPLWYNGFAPMRYWPPLSPVVYFLCECLSGGRVFIAYIYYCLVVFIGGIITWNIVGCLFKRPVFGSILGLLWFFLPNNLYAMFGEGNLPRSLSMVFLPLFFAFIVKYMLSGRWGWLAGVVLTFVVLFLCHVGYAGMIAFAVLMFLIIWCCLNGFWARACHEIIGMVTGFLLIGIYLMPSLHGGISLDNSETVKTFFQSIFITLNPVYRITDSPLTFYFGISVFILCMIGIFASGKQSVPGFLCAVCIVFLTTNTAKVAILVLPLSSIMWMLRFLSIALCMAMISLLLWRSLKKWLLIVFLAVIVLDCIPSFYWIVGNHNGLQPDTRLSEIAENDLITRAKEICDQRIALFDVSSLGAEGAYLVSCFDGEDPGVFGAGWEAAVTSVNITRLNKSVDDGYFDYMFTRCLEMGADTVIIQKINIDDGEKGLVRLDRAAERCGYDIIAENEGYLLYHREVGGTFGTVSDYDAIGIGYSSGTLSFAFPNIKETDDDYLDHYSFAELSKYDTVYLSGFYYDDKDVAENLVKKLAQSGVDIVILADGIPENKETRSKTFLGVTCNVVQFENGYPVFYSEDFGEIDCDLFPTGYSKWTTYYLNGLSDVRGTFVDNDIELAFYGTGLYDNIRYVGLNIPFYYYLTQDNDAGNIMQWVMGMESGRIPDIKVVPIDIRYGKDDISIISDKDGVLTGLAFHDNFVTQQEVSSMHNMLVVQSGTTNIKIVYPYLKQGIVVTFFGIVCLVLLLWYSHFSENLRRENM